MWTSAHGFHHYTLSNKKAWRLVWAIILFILVVSLVCCIIYYFYYVFSTAVYSRISIESPVIRKWPRTIVCEKQVFTAGKIAQISSLSIAQASILSWSVAPELSKPEIYATKAAQISSLEEEIGFILSRGQFGQDLDKLLKAMAPNCTEFILECKLGSIIKNGKQCCTQIFDPAPFLSRYGTCFSTVPGLNHELSLAGEGSGLTVVTMHDAGNSFDRTFASSELFGASGVAFAVNDGTNTIEASLRGQGQIVEPGKIASIGISRTITDNSDLELSAIGRMKCIPPGSLEIEDEDLMFGLNNYGYTKDNCLGPVKKEILSRAFFDCSFNPRGAMKRCTPLQSATFYRSFLDSNKTAIDRIDLIDISDRADIKLKHDKACIQDCVQDRYSMASSYSDLSDNLKAELQAKMSAAGVSQASNVVVLKFYLNSMEYTKIYNFPQHGLQFVAEVKLFCVKIPKNSAEVAVWAWALGHIGSLGS